MQKNLPVLVLMLFSAFSTFGQQITINSNAGTSGNIVTGASNYHASESIYLESEIGASNFTTSATSINNVQFSVNTLGAPTSITNFKVYMKDVPLATTVLATGVYSTAGYTLVFSGTYNATATGFVGFSLTTPYVRASGTNLEVLIERTDGVLHSGYVWDASTGNTTAGNAVNSTRRYNATTIPVSGTSTLTASNFREAIKLSHIYPNDAGVQQVYTLGKLPIPYGAPHVISANIVNVGTTTQTNLNVTLNVTGVNTFTNSQIIPTLAPGASTNVTFAGFTPTVTGSENVIVSVPSDDNTSNNSLSISQLVTPSAYSYAYGTVASGGVGFNGATGDFVAKFSTSSPTTVNQVAVNFSAGGQPFKVGIWDATGAGGTPGTLLYSSTAQTSTIGVYTLAISPAVAVNGGFFVGVMQTGTTNVSFSYQTETPIRSGTFYYTSPSGGSAWTDFAPANSFKFMIEPRLTLANDVGVSTIDIPVGGINSFCNSTITPKATIANFGSASQTFTATIVIKQGASVVYTDSKPLSMSGGTTQQVSFSPTFTPVAGGSYTASVSTSLGTDADNSNDAVSNAFTYQQVDWGGGGATSGGYYFANSTPCAAGAPSQPTYGWITETTNLADGSWNTSGDDGISPAITLPFTFTFFGNSYTQFWIGANGWITFTDPTTVTDADRRTTVAIPTAGGLDNYIAGALTDLDVTNATYADAHVYYGGNASRYVISFIHAHAFGSTTDYVTFQIVIYSNGKIVIQYDNSQSTNPLPVSITNASTVGIENSTGTAGIQYRFGTAGGPMFGSPLAVAFSTNPGALPVTVTDFNVTRNQSVNLLSWTTSQEFNTSKFIAERSNDGRNFTAIREVTAAGTSSVPTHYQITDAAPAKGINYYRIRIIDRDQQYKFTEIRQVRNTGNADFVITPNPVSEILNVVINADNADKGSITITDASGKESLTRSISLNAGRNSIPLDLGGLASGVYIIKIQLSADQVVKKFSKL